MCFWTANLFVNLQSSLHLSVSMPLSLPRSSCLSYLYHSDTWYPTALTNPRPQLGHRGTICTHLLALRSRYPEAFWVVLAGPRHLFFSFKPLSCVPVVSWMKAFCSVVSLAFFLVQNKCKPASSLLPSYCIHGGGLWWSRSVMSDSVTPWTVAHQAPPSMGFSRQE